MNRWVIQVIKSINLPGFSWNYFALNNPYFAPINEIIKAFYVERYIINEQVVAFIKQNYQIDLNLSRKMVGNEGC